MDECICGWEGENFQTHHEETALDDVHHVEISPLMKEFIYG